MKIKLNADLNGHSKGSIITVDDISGMPTDIYWRNRLKDAVIDNCVEVVSDKVKPEPKKEVKVQEEKKDVAADKPKKSHEVKNDDSKPSDS